MTTEENDDAGLTFSDIPAFNYRYIRFHPQQCGIDSVLISTVYSVDVRVYHLSTTSKVLTVDVGMN
jgi:hypothetical protein